MSAKIATHKSQVVMVLLTSGESADVRNIPTLQRQLPTYTASFGLPHFKLQRKPTAWLAV